MKTNRFTLLELLIAIGILAILAALLLPALGSARRKTHTIACAGNLRSIGSASAMYSSDYDDYVVPGKAYTGDSLTPWDLPFLLSGGRNSYDTGIRRLKKPYGVFFDAVDGKNSTFVCPAEENRLFSWNGNFPLGHYGYNFGQLHVNITAGNNSNDPSKGRKTSTVTTPSMALSLFDVGRRSDNGNAVYTTAMTGNVHYRHGSGDPRGEKYSQPTVTPNAGNANILYYDGHVSLQTPAHLLSVPFNPNYPTSKLYERAFFYGIR